MSQAIARDASCRRRGVDGSGELRCGSTVFAAIATLARPALPDRDCEADAARAAADEQRLVLRVRLIYPILPCAHSRPNCGARFARKP
jgi:hypothetical protein